MGLITTFPFSDFSIHKLLRFDYKYLNYKNNKKSFENHIKLKDVLNSYFKGFAFKGEDFQPNGNVYVLKGDVFNKDFSIDFSNIQYLDDDFLYEYEKFKISKDDIVISLVGSIGKMVIIEEDYPMLLNQNNIALKINQEKFNIKFFSYIVKNELREIANVLYGNSGYSFLSIDDLFNLEIPNIPLNIQNEIVQKIEPIEQEIQTLKAQKKEHLEIINKVFADEFDFDLDCIAKERDKKLYKASFVELANDELKFDISLKYKAIFEKSLLKSSNQWIKLDKIVEVKGGKRLPKGENILEEDTGYKYIRVDDLSWGGFFDYENVKYITYENHLAIKNYISNTDDILLTIVGATVGKCGLVTDEIDGHNITENFSRLIIKDKTKYFPQYVTYCLQSKICQLQIDEFTGKGSQGKLALFRVKKIRIPDIEFAKQLQIVEKIKSQIDAQKLIDEQIEQKQKEISDLIYRCVQNS